MQRAAKHPLVRRIVSGLISLAIVVGIFVFAIPKVADYSEVWKAFESLTGLELALSAKSNDAIVIAWSSIT